MRKNIISAKSEIYLFKMMEGKKTSQFAITDFLAYLKFIRHPDANKFSFVGSDANFIKDLTLIQNILLDYSSPSLTEEKEAHFKNLMKWQPNFHMEALFSNITSINELPFKASLEELKLASLIKAFLSDRPFLFLENPEKHLSEKSLMQFKEALKYQVENYPEKNIFIKSETDSIWSSLITKTVYRNFDYSFHTESNAIESAKFSPYRFKRIKIAA
jgi:hypothetical protein